MAGTITQDKDVRGPIGIITLTCTADSSDGSFPAVALETKISGKLLALETNPGSPAPTDNYDIALDDAEGFDVLQALGANRDTANTEKVFLLADTGIFSVVAKSDVLTFKITNNSVNSAIVVAKLYFEGTSEG